MEGVEGGMLAVTESGLPDQESGSGEPLKEIVEGKRHALVPYMTENRTRYFIVKAPNEDFLIQGIKSCSWSLSQKSYDRIKVALDSVSDQSPVLALVSIANSHRFQGVFRFTNHLLKPAKDAWLKIYPGP